MRKKANVVTENFGECMEEFKKFVKRDFFGDVKVDMLKWCSRIEAAHKRSVFNFLDACDLEIKRARASVREDVG